MKTRLITFIVLASVTVGCGSGPSRDATDDSRLTYKPAVNEVETVVLRRGDFPVQLLSNGKLAAAQKSSLYFPESGQIVRINVADGTQVQAGDVIAELDSREQQTALESARIELEKSRLEYLDVLAGLGYQENGEIPEEVLALAEIRSGYRSAKNSYAKAERALEGTVLKAPFPGKVADLKLKVWDRTGSEPFCTVIDDRTFDVVFTILESEYSFVEKGQPVRVSLFGDDGNYVNGRISSINPTIDKNGQITVTASVQGSRSMIDGMNVKVIVDKMLHNQLSVPKSAVVIRDNLEVLFRYNAGKSDWVYVNTLNANSEGYVIKANEDRGAVLNEGDLIIVSGNLNLADGSQVSLKEEK